MYTSTTVTALDRHYVRLFSQWYCESHSSRSSSRNKRERIP